jgi:hypothetical protein
LNIRKKAQSSIPEQSWPKKKILGSRTFKAIMKKMHYDMYADSVIVAKQKQPDA